VSDFIPYESPRHLRSDQELLFQELKIYKAAARTNYAKRHDLPRYVFFPTMNGPTILGLPWFSAVQEEVRTFGGFNHTNCSKILEEMKRNGQKAEGEKRQLLLDLCSRQLKTKWTIGYQTESEYYHLLFIVLIPDWLWRFIEGDLFGDGVPGWLSTYNPTRLELGPSFSFLRHWGDDKDIRSFSMKVDFLDYYPSLCNTKIFRNKIVIEIPKYFLSWEDHDEIWRPGETRSFPPRGKVPFVLLYNKLGILIFFREAYMDRTFKNSDGREEVCDYPLPLLPEGCSFLNEPTDL
jgi:hypothetical protein